MRLRGMFLGFVGACVCACAKPVAPTPVRAAPIHPELQCPAGTFAAGAAPPQGNEAWCEQRPEAGPSVRVGPSLTWHDNGQKASQGGYAQDLQAGPWLSWHANGQLAEQGAYAVGVKEGVWTAYDSQGRRLSEGPYAAGQPDGSWTFWNPDDQTRTEGQYVLGKREGTWVEYAPEGTPVKERTFRNDRQLDIRTLR